MPNPPNDPSTSAFSQASTGPLQPDPIAGELPASVDQYRIIRVIGAGGMGIVYEAEQQRPNRIVALKLVRPGYSNGEMLRRFEQEAEVLGRLQHPGIAQIFEAGTADLGAGIQPFFAMELIQGLPLLEHASQRGLGTRERLELFARICDAVQHAHQKGVIHRDLKPANILVTSDGQPKVLDFGVARIVDLDARAATLQTNVGQLVGTIPYMSPEQVAGDPSELDTRSDIYALGIVAFELLSGRLPYSLDRRMIHEAARIIREQEPTRLSSIDQSLRGDVETIVAHALEKDRARRYQSVSSLAADIRRYLANEPISARPATAWYQISKFARRHRTVVGGAVAAIVILVAGVIATGIALRRALNAEKSLGDQLLATETARKEEIAQRELVEARGKETSQVAAFQARMITNINTPTAGAHLMASIRERYIAATASDGLSAEEHDRRFETLSAALDRVNATDVAASVINQAILAPASIALDKEFRDLPLVDATLRYAIGDAQFRLGIFDSAAAMTEASWKARETALGADDSLALESLSAHVAALRSMGRLDDAQRLGVDGLARANSRLGERHSVTIGLLIELAIVRQLQSELREAIELFSKASNLCRSVFGPDDPRTLTADSSLVQTLMHMGRHAEAEAIARRVLDSRRRVLGNEHNDTLVSVNDLGTVLAEQGKFDEAEPFVLEAVERNTKLLGENHIHTIIARGNLAGLYRGQRRIPEALAEAERFLTSCQRAFGENNPSTIQGHSNLSVMLLEQGRAAESEPHARRGYEGCRSIFGPEHMYTLYAAHNLARSLIGLGHWQEAEECLLPTIEIAARTLPPTQPVRHALFAATIDLYSKWENASPGEGFAARAAEFRRQAEDLQATPGDR